ncbi:MAG: phosphoribosylaminoimidazolesuccinocarboxamide synthase [candidate division Zixibacteria bacterium]|nr:phosphoribosylaminoimidazolesuccinocarboxamide synthase [candidate division Zixibacteria bacterium]
MADITDTAMALLKTNLSDIPLFRRGKVRDIYDLGEHLLLVATDRVSAFDVVMPEGIPDKGKILTALSVFWFELLRGVVPNHLVAQRVRDFPKELQKHRDQLEGRSLLVKKARRIDLECVVRGYIAGSLWKEYRAARRDGGQPVHLYDYDFPGNLLESQKLPEPIFTPATKEDTGHDQNISVSEAKKRFGAETVDKLRSISLAIFHRASDYAFSRGIILVDTKFEFGFTGDQLSLIDEVLSPDSSRFWLASQYRLGEAQDGFDKQFLRNYLESMKWDKKPPAPHLPEEVILKTREKYLEAYRLLTGQDF